MKRKGTFLVEDYSLLTKSLNAFLEVGKGNAQGLSDSFGLTFDFAFPTQACKQRNGLKGFEDFVFS